MIQKNILFEESAVIETLKELDTLIGYKQYTHKLINKGRYCIVYGDKNYGCPNIAILLKREVFFNFGYQFKEYGQTGVGDSINVTSIREFVQNNVKLIYIKFGDGRLYVIPLDTFLKKSFKWTQKEGTEVRSVSIHLYKRVN